MIYIAHRGNLYGPSDRENTLHHINEALDKGFAVEVDVLDFRDNLFYLGHDQEQCSVSKEFLSGKNIFAHAKNLKSLDSLMTHGIQCFYHTNEDYVLTSTNLIWAYPGQVLNDKTICVLPELYPMKDWKRCYGICSDYVANYRKEFEV